MIIWYDGFEHYGGAGHEAHMLDGLWAELDTLSSDPAGHVALTNVHPATGNFCLAYQCFANTRRSIGGDFTEFGVAQRWFFENLPRQRATFWLAQFRNVENVAHCGIMMGTTGRIFAVGADGTIYGSSTLELAAGSWNHVEVKAKIDAAAGYIHVKCNGVDFLNATGLNTDKASSGSHSCAQLFFGASSINFSGDFVGLAYQDDVVPWNLVTTDNIGGTAAVVDFIGQYGVYYLPPIADGSPQDWTCTLGTSAYLMVNELTPDDATNFIFTSVLNKKTELTPAPLPSNILSVLAMMPIARNQKTDTGDCSISLGVNSSATEQLKTAHPTVTSWDWNYDVLELDPHTSSAWNPASLPAMVAKRIT